MEPTCQTLTFGYLPDSSVLDPIFLTLDMVGSMVVLNNDGSLACICHEHHPICKCAGATEERAELQFHLFSIGWLATSVRRWLIHRSKDTRRNCSSADS